MMCCNFYNNPVYPKLYIYISVIDFSNGNIRIVFCDSFEFFLLEYNYNHCFLGVQSFKHSALRRSLRFGWNFITVPNSNWDND